MGRDGEEHGGLSAAATGRKEIDSDADSGRSRSVLGLNFSFAPFKVGQCTFEEEKISFKASGHRFVQTDSHFWAM